MTGDPLEIRCRHGVPSGGRGIVMPEDEPTVDACPDCQEDRVRDALADFADRYAEDDR